MIDDQFAPLSDEIIKAIESVGGNSPMFVLNTHFHGDHTGGNENFRREGAVLVAHHNVRSRLATQQYNTLLKRSTPASVEAALPVVTYEYNIRFHWNTDILQLTHLPQAHTDGDTIVHFKNANVIHTGDIVFNGRFPFIDIDAGGTIRGMIAATRTLLEIANIETVIIPGHGELMTQQDLNAYLAMLEVSVDRISHLKAGGKSREEIVAAQPMADHEHLSWAFINTDTWVGLVFDSL